MPKCAVALVLDCAKVAKQAAAILQGNLVLIQHQATNQVEGESYRHLYHSLGTSRNLEIPVQTTTHIDPDLLVVCASSRSKVPLVL